MNDLAYLLDNLAEHTSTMEKLLDDSGIDSEFKTRMIEHIVMEERENTRQLQALDAQDDLRVRIALDHSYFLQKIGEEENLPLAMKRELLHHFTEEHEILLASLERKEVKKHEWTVGSLLGLSK